jgi:hypothetical protein
METKFAAKAPEQFQEKCEAVFHPELRQNKKIERFGVSINRRTVLGSALNSSRRAWPDRLVQPN